MHAPISGMSLAVDVHVPQETETDLEEAMGATIAAVFNNARDARRSRHEGRLRQRSPCALARLGRHGAFPLETFTLPIT